MDRNQRKTAAEETVAICKAGQYLLPGGSQVDVREEISRAVKGTVLYSLEDLPRLSTGPGTTATKLEVTNETTFSAVTRLREATGHVACLNFASAKNPGGGFLNGSQAQEEALARSSALFPCLLAAPGHYERNRANRSALYLDLAIFSPQVPFFRDDTGKLLPKPILASVITAAAPNAGAIRANEPAKVSLIAPTLERRTEIVLHIAQAHAVDRLVLGAWGCGVFQNDPVLVARSFIKLLTAPGKFNGVFKVVVFAIYDRSENQGTYRAFRANIL